MSNLPFKPAIPLFLGYMQPHGYLDQHRESHALWYYYLTARNVYETHIEDIVVLEGDVDPPYNFRQLFTSVARMYGVQPEGMGKCWLLVDKQCDLLGLPRMPEGERYRFDSKIQLLN